MGGVGHHQSGGGVEQHGVAIGAGLALEQGTERRGIMGGVAAANGGDGMGREAEVRGGQAAHRDHAVGRHLGNVVAAGEREFVEALVARHDHRMGGAQLAQCVGIDGDIGGASDADELATDIGGIGERPHQVEDGAFADRPADRAETLERRMIILREQEADAQILERGFCRGGRAIEIKAQRFERVGGPRLGRGSAIAMLGDRHAGGRDHQADGGRDVERMMAVAAGAADVDRAVGRVDRDHPGAHRTGGGGDLRRGLAAPRHGDEEAGDRLVRQVGVEQQVEGAGGFVGGQGRAGIGQQGHGPSL